MISNLILVFVAIMCQEFGASDISKSASGMNVTTPTANEPIPRDIFPLNNFTSTDSKEYKSTLNAIMKQWMDSTKQLKKQYIAKLSDATLRLFQSIEEISHVDKKYIETMQQYHPISVWEGANQAVNYLILVSGDDFGMNVLYQFDRSKNMISATRISGGLCGGPIAENDSIIAGCQEEISVLNNDTLFNYVKYSASYKTARKNDITDSGLVVMKIRFDKVDTLSIRGINSESKFIKLHHLE